MEDSLRLPPREDNKLRFEDRVAHDWYRFVLSYPAHLVRSYLDRFDIQPGQTVLDPFCGTGTTLVECKKLGVRSVGLDPNPVAVLASRVKTDWSVEPEALVGHASEIARLTNAKLRAQGIDEAGQLPLFQRGARPTPKLRTLPDEVAKLLLTQSISPLPLHKTLTLLETLGEREDQRFSGIERLALAKSLVTNVGNLHFGPEVGVGRPKSDADVVSSWLAGVRTVAGDLEGLRDLSMVESMVHQADAREIAQVVRANSVDAVITSPPYPNEKDYTRTTRLESVLLGFVKTKEDLRSLKRALVRSNTRGVYINDTDDLLVEGHIEIQRIARAIEARRIELGKTSGFERLYARVAKLYFGGIKRHLLALRSVLRPGACLAYVVGDQASYLRVMIRTGEIIADIASSVGYEVVGIDLFRTRLATATKEQLREEVVVLRWPKTNPGPGLGKKRSAT